ncbi:microtubule-associated protein, RP/EB family, partial [Lecanoromycetidae sp. Uapishka_2]
MGESRQELLAWLNNLLQLNVTKVEQCGTGAALCQIYDSIFHAFTRHSIERQVPVESLIKCKMQDNLEFLQWSKRYWDQYFPGGDYDALARRKGAGSAGGGPPPAAAPASSRTSGAGAGAARRGTTPTTTPAARSTRPAVGGGASAAIQQENTQLKSTVEGLERERDFYFSKLRDIELLLQQAVEQDPELEKDDEGLVKHIQAILYSTEEGFEIPAEAEGTAVDDQETF